MGTVRRAFIRDPAWGKDKAQIWLKLTVSDRPASLLVPYREDVDMVLTERKASPQGTESVATWHLYQDRYWHKLFSALPASMDEFNALIETARQQGIDVVNIGCYCPLDKNCHTTELLEFVRRHRLLGKFKVKGTADILYRPRLKAWVGNRSVRDWSDDQKRVLLDGMIEVVRQDNCVVVSGGSWGSDKAAHIAAMRAGLETVAVLPCGIRRTFAEVSDLERRATGNLVLVSEFEDNSDFSGRQAYVRNRSIIELGDETVVVHVTESRGGTWNDVEIAKELGKPLRMLHHPWATPLMHELVNNGTATWKELG